MVSDTILTFRNHSRLGRVGDADLRTLRSHELDRVIIDLLRRHVLGCLRVPSITCRAFDRRVQSRVEVLDGIFSTAICNPFNAPTDGTITVVPAEFKILRPSIFIMDRGITIVRADASSLSVAPHDLLVSLAIQDDRTFGRTDSGILNTCLGPPGTLHVGLIGVSGRNRGDLASDGHLSSIALADLGPVIEGERE